MTASLPLGVVPDLPFEDYLQDPSVSCSTLKDMEPTPHNCWALHIDPKRPARREPTPAMKAGTLAHALILEPRTVLSRYAIKPAGLDGRTTAGKEWLANVGDRTIIDADQMAVAVAQRESVMALPEVREYMEAGVAEASVFWNDSSTGMRCRARPDWLQPLGPKFCRVLDIKTISKLTPTAVQRAVVDYRYFWQQAHYTRGLRASGYTVAEFLFVFVSGSYPFTAGVFQLDDAAVEQGDIEVSAALENYAECKRTGVWPGFSGRQIVELPKWARMSEEVEVSYA